MTEQNPNIDSSGPDGPTLTPDDARALDALADAGFDSGKIAAPDARVERAAGLLSMLAGNIRAHPSLADVTMARVLREATGASQEPVLSADDQEALEAWIMHGYDAARVAPSLRERAAKHAGLAAMAVGQPGAEPLDSALADRTLARVAAFEEVSSQSFRLPARKRGLSIRLADFLSVAAVVLIGAGLVLPVMSAVREEGRRGLCRTNLGSTASAMSTYAGSNRDSLPMAAASLGGGRWWDVGTPQHSNSANLYTLAHDGYLKLATLACPGNPEAPTATTGGDARDWRRLEEISYSYQIMFGPRPAWNNGQVMVVLADRSPVVLRAVRGEPIDPFANAPNHRGAGQHLLSTDGSVTWATSPVLKNGDNIWLPRAYELRPRPLSGTELPAAADDTCLGP
jgi:hypothetical protein